MEIVIDHLTKKFGGKKALNDVSFVVEKGMFGLLGKNGAGKTTLMRTIATLLNKTSGNITVCGIPVDNAKEIRKITGYLPQEFSIYPKMKVYQALDYLGVLSGMSKRERSIEIERVLEQVNLIQSKRVKVKALSGGMKRRLGIAQAILHNPKVLIVDEPTVGLDPQERIRFRNLLCEIASDRIVVLSTHIVEDIQSTCEKIAILDQGKLLYQGSVQNLIETAQNHVFQAVVSKQQLEELKVRYPITSMVTNGGEVHVRILAKEQPCENAVLCVPTMEDAYILRISKENQVQMNTSKNEMLGGGTYVS